MNQVIPPEVDLPDFRRGNYAGLYQGLSDCAGIIVLRQGAEKRLTREAKRLIAAQSGNIRPIRPIRSLSYRIARDHHGNFTKPRFWFMLAV